MRVQVDRPNSDALYSTAADCRSQGFVYFHQYGYITPNLRFLGLDLGYSRNLAFLAFEL